MRLQLCFALAPFITFLILDSKASAQGECKHETDFSQNGAECQVPVTKAACDGLVRDNKQDWPINKLFPVCLGRGENLQGTGHAAHAVRCNRYYTDKHTACQNKLMMECAYRGMFGRGVIWVDDPNAIYQHGKGRVFAYAEVVFMKNVLCGLPLKNKPYLYPQKQP